MYFSNYLKLTIYWKFNNEDENSEILEYLLSAVCVDKYFIGAYCIFVTVYYLQFNFLNICSLMGKDFIGASFRCYFILNHLIASTKSYKFTFDIGVATYSWFEQCESVALESNILHRGRLAVRRKLAFQV